MRAKAFGAGLLAVFAFLCCAAAIFAQGSANVPLLAQMNKYPSAQYNDCWGYTAPDGREYALLGVRTGTSIVDITDTNNLVEVAFIPGLTSSWRDLKTYQHYAYVVNEAGGGMHIIDLSNLPNSATLAATYTGFSTSHNIYIDVPAAILYAEGDAVQPVRVLSLANPTSPVQIGYFGIECHDIYAQNGLAYVSEGNQRSVGIYDVSNPAAAVRLKTILLLGVGYVHNAWASADGGLLMTTEETSGYTVKLWNTANLNDITLTDEYLGPSGLAHNTHLKGNYAYISHYGDGLRIVDISDPNNIFEAGYYDTYTAPNTGFVGDWGAFPFFASGKVLVSDIQSGLYVVFFDDGNTPPLITSTPGATVTAGQPYAYDADNTVNVLGTPTITFSFTGPAGFNVVPNTGAVSWTPTPAQVGSHLVSITATNGVGVKTQNFTVTVNGGSTWQVITYDDFESGMGSYTDGGADMARYTGTTHAHQGAAAANIQDNSGTASSFYHTASYNVTGYQTLEVDFWFKMVSMESNEDFWVQFFDGATWRTVATFARNSSFRNNTFYHQVATISRSTYNFPANAKLRFMCDASDNNDDVYIDQIEFRGLTNGAFVPGGHTVSGAETLPESFELKQNYPNPFNPSTTINYQIPEAGRVTLRIYDLLGQLVTTLVDREVVAGTHSVVWAGKNERGELVAAGVYIYRLEAAGVVRTKKMVLAK